MRKTVYRTMKVGELRRFLKKYVGRAPLQALPMGGVPGERVECAFTAGGLLEAMDGHDDEEPGPVFPDKGDIWMVFGFLCTAPPTLVVGRSSQSIQSN